MTQSDLGLGNVSLGCCGNKMGEDTLEEALGRVLY